MQRQWRSKPTKELIKLFEESVDIRLYLIQEKGPLSFVFQDDSKKKFTITIGESISCSCGGGRIEHCVHTLYVLNRMFKIQYTDTLILQINYSDSELSKLVDTRNSYNRKETNKVINRKGKLLEESVSISNNLGHRMNLFDDPTCPICQEDIYEIEGLFYCANSCGHNYHLNCLKVWAEHKKATSDLISCPMCRAEWNEDDLKKMIIKHIADRHTFIIKPHKGINCNTCNRINIKAERFHCLNCANFDMCVQCYNLNKHDTSHCFIVKKKVDDKWLGVEYNAGIGIGSYNIKNIKLSQYLISILKDKEKTISDANEDINIEETTCDNKCVYCNSDRASSLQLLKLKIFPNCKHSVHFKCADNLFKMYDSKGNDTTGNLQVDANFNICKIDKCQIFVGLSSLKLKLKTNEKESDIKIKLNIDNKIKEINNFSNDFLTINSFPTKGNFNTRPKTIIQLNNIRRFHSNNHSLRKMENNTIGLAMNIQKINTVDIHPNNEENKSRITKLKKLYSNSRPMLQKPNKVNIYSDRIMEKSNSNEIDRENNHTYSNITLGRDLQLDKMYNMNNNGIKIVNLNKIGFKVKSYLNI